MFLYGDYILLMYRIGSRLFTENICVEIDRHFEDVEMNDPQKCVLHKLKEESELNPDDIINVPFKHITTLKTNYEIRQQYIYLLQI